MATPLPLLQRDMVNTLQLVDRKGWVANHDGNASVRLAGNRYLITPTSFSKFSIREQDLLVINGKKQVLQGKHRPFSEMDMHLAAFAVRGDARAVLHAHCPESVALSMVGVEVNPTLIPEAIVSLGARIPMLPHAFPGSEVGLEALTNALHYYDVVVLENHGVISIGKDLEQAYLRMELCEHIAGIQRRAMTLGTPKPIPREDIDRLLFKRKKAGLGYEARGLSLPNSGLDSRTTLVGPCSGPIEA